MPHPFSAPHSLQACSLHVYLLHQLAQLVVIAVSEARPLQPFSAPQSKQFGSLHVQALHHGAQKAVTRGSAVQSSTVLNGLSAGRIPASDGRVARDWR